MSRNRKKRAQKKKSLPLSKILLDIVICVYGKFDLLTRCLDSIPEAAGNIPYRIILVDNASPDRDEFYADLETKVTLIKNNENKGFILGSNQGASRGKSPLLFMLNSDVILDPGSIEKMVAALDIPEIGVVGMKLRFPELKEHLHAVEDAGKVQHVGLATSIKGDFYHLFIGWDVDAPKVNAVREVLAVTGAALMTRRNLWKKIGGFNPMYGIGTYEDVEFCLNVQAMEKKVVMEVKATGIHFTNATAKEYNIGYPLQQNNMFLKSIWASRYPWTAWWHH